jgi:2-polyprenyl-6-methoxyphenol hydroxylase-like FAD-dependent oxidoreductase
MALKLRVAVCGCGPAGLAAALLLHRTGHRVQLFERFDTPQPVGSGLLLQPTGLGVLAELGMVERLASLGTPIDRIFGRVSSSSRVVLDVRYSALGDGFRALAIHRAALFGTLHEAVVAAGIEIVYASQLVRAEVTSNEAALIAADGRRHGGFDLIVDAAGANSPLAVGIARRKALPYGALWVNVPLSDSGRDSRPDRGAHSGPDCWPGPQNALEQRYRRAIMMAGLLPVGRRAPNEPRLAAFFWSMRRDQVPVWRSKGLSAWKDSVARLWPEAATLLEPVIDLDQVTFAQYDHFTAHAPVSDRVVHIGDAARATSPQLGQGANMALLDALALSRALETNGPLGDALNAYVRMRYWHIRTFQWASAMFTPFYQSDGYLLAFVRDWLAGPISGLPIGRNVLARLVSGMTVAPLAGGKFQPLRLGLPPR